jgi:hypothetical protein
MFIVNKKPMLTGVLIALPVYAYGALNPNYANGFY